MLFWFDQIRLRRSDAHPLDHFGPFIGAAVIVIGAVGPSLAQGSAFLARADASPVIDIVLPREALLRQVSLDEDVLDSSSYTFSGGRLLLHLSSGDGPFLQDLLVMYRIPVRATLVLLLVGLVAVAGRQVGLREKARVARLRRG